MSRYRKVKVVKTIPPAVTYEDEEGNPVDMPEEA